MVLKSQLLIKYTLLEELALWAHTIPLESMPLPKFSGRKISGFLHKAVREGRVRRAALCAPAVAVAVPPERAGGHGRDSSIFPRVSAPR